MSFHIEIPSLKLQFPASYTSSPFRTFAIAIPTLESRNENNERTVKFHTHTKASAKTIARKVTAWKLTKAVIMLRVYIVLFVRRDSFRTALFLANVSVNNDNDWRVRYEFGETSLILFEVHVHTCTFAPCFVRRF